MWATALAPGTTGPSMAVVKKILLPQTIGEECPRPSIAAFHLMFFVGLHSAGRFFSFDVPWPEGPRHCGQLPDEAPTDTTRIVRAKRRPAATTVRPITFICFVNSLFC